MVVSRFFYWTLLLLSGAVLVAMPVLVSAATLPFVYWLFMASVGVVAYPLFGVDPTERQLAVYLLGLALAGVGVLASLGGSFPVALGFVVVSFLCMIGLYSNLIGHDDA